VNGSLNIPQRSNKLRITMAVNYWPERPKAEYLRDSRECMAAFGLKA
jgi:hypothetical protein